MNDIYHSDTIRPVSDDIDGFGSEGYSSPELIASTPLTCVYRLRDGDKTVCIKTPAKDSGLLLDLLKREYAIGVGLSHPFTVSYLKWEADSPVGPGIVMEYVDGCSLDEFLEANKDAKTRERIFSQLLDAVEYLHECGIVHNDLKPANILINRVNRSLKLIDFGFSDNDANTLRRALGGTSGYASPELSSGERDTDARSDIYSLGILMHKIFGRRYGLIRRHCTAADPSHRYPSVSALRKALTRARRMPRTVIIFVLSGLLCAALGYSLFVTSRSADAAAVAKTRIDNLNDSIARLNNEITDLNGYVDDIHLREQRREALIKLYNSGADSLANDVIARLNKCTDVAGMLALLGTYRETFMQYDKKFRSNHPGDGAEIVDQMSAGVMNRTYERIKAKYDKIYTRLQATSSSSEQENDMK